MSADDDWNSLKAKPAPAPNAEADKEWAALKAKPAPAKPQDGDAGPLSPKSTTGAAAHGLVQGGTLGFGDEIAGALSADMDSHERMQRIAEETKKAKAEGRFGEDIQPPPQVKWQLKRPGLPTQTTVRPASSPNEPQPELGSWLRDYITSRDSMRKDDATASDAHPYAYGGAELAGSLAVPVPGPGKLKGGARLLAHGGTGAVLGGTSAAGHSTADNPLDLAEDTAVGGGAGGVLGLGGGVIGDRLAARGVAAQQAARDAAEKAAEKAVNSARGALGGEVAAGSRNLEMLERAANDASLPQNVRDAASSWLASPEAQALRERVSSGHIAAAPERLGRITDAETGLNEALAGSAPSVVARQAADAVSPGAAVRALTSRAKTLAERAIPIAIGGTLGGPGGLAAGALTSGVIGRPGTILANAMKNPAVQYQFSRVATPVAGGVTKVAEQAAGSGAQSMRKKALDAYEELLAEKKDGGQ